MPRYRFVALAENGQEVKGEVESISEPAARNVLLLRNLEIRQIAKARKRLSEIEITKQSVKQTEIMHFSRQLGAFVRGGIPLADGLDVIAEGTSSKRWREILLTMREEIATGVPFSDALAQHAAVLPPYYLGIIRSAELTGRLDTALEQLSTYMERNLATRSKVKSALMYPMVVLGLAIVVVTILVTYVLPKFADFFSSFGAKLPLTTRMLVSIAHFSKNFWWVYPLVFLAVILTGLWLWKDTRGMRVRDKLIIKVPLLGEIVQFAAVERVCRILGAMSRAAVPLPEAMTAAIRGANNSVFEGSLQKAHERMLEGEGLATPMTDTGLFPRAAVQMVRVGEQTGTLDDQLDSAAEYYAHELDYKLARLTTLFEPAVIIFMGLIVGFVALALVQAMYGIYNSPALKHI
jgi:type IV pilus assembly protein PilC